MAEQRDDDLRRIKQLIHRINQHTDRQERRMEKEEEDKKQEEDVSFATSSLLTCFENVEIELDEALFSLNEYDIKTSKEEHTLPALLIIQNRSKCVPSQLKKVKEDGKEHKDAQHKRRRQS